MRHDQVKNKAATLATKSCRGWDTDMHCLAAHMESSLNTCGRVLRRYLVNVTQIPVSYTHLTLPTSDLV